MMRRHWRRALRRLRTILEEDRGRGSRATIAGGPRKPATPLPAPRYQTQTHNALAFPAREALHRILSVDLT